MFLAYPTLSEVGHGHHGERLPRRSRRDHLSVLLGVTVRCDLYRRDRRCRRASSAIDLLEWLRIDDPIGAVAVHGFCGIWGTLSLGLFATGQYFLPTPTGADVSTPVEGLVLRRRREAARRPDRSAARSSRCRRSSIGLVVMYGVKALGVLRVSEEVELGGSTSTSTAHRRTTPSPRTPATRRCLRDGPSAWPRSVPNLRPSASGTEEDTCNSSRQSSSRTSSKT